MGVRKPKLAFHGRDRKRIKGLQNFLIQIQKMDIRIAAQATVAGVPDVRFATAAGVNLTGAITQLLERCTSSLTQQVSQQAVAQAPRV